MKITYLDTYIPPIPCLQIGLAYPGNTFTLGPFDAMIDTGADATIIPRSMVDELDAPFIDDAWMSSQWENGFPLKPLPLI